MGELYLIEKNKLPNPNFQVSSFKRKYGNIKQHLLKNYNSILGAIFQVIECNKIKYQNVIRTK
jgi:hypothetical protein